MSEEMFNNEQEQRNAVNRYEEMVRNHGNYFFDTFAFENIIDYYIEKDNPLKALQVTKFAINQHPYFSTFLIKQAQLYLILGKYDKAEVLLDKAKTLDPSESEIPFVKGNMFFLLGKYPQALESLHLALELTDEPIDIWLQIAFTYQQMNAFEEALPYFKKVLLEDMENSEALYNLALCCEVLNKEEEEPIKFYTHYLDEHPFSHLAWYNLGYSYHKLEQFEKAVDAYDYAILIKENFVAALYNKGYALLRMEKFSEAIEIFTSTYEYESPNADTYCAIGECYEKLSQMDTARIYYKKAVKADPQMADAWFGIGVTLSTEERNFEATHFYHKALEIDAEDADVWFALADAQCKIGLLDDAEESYSKAVSFNPFDIEAWLDYSVLLHEEKRTTEAIELIKNALEQNPEGAELYYRLVAYLFAEGKYNDGLTYLDTALKISIDKYELLFEYLPQLRNSSTIVSFINRYL